MNIKLILDILVIVCGAIIAGYLVWHREDHEEEKTVSCQDPCGNWAPENLNMERENKFSI